MRYYIIAGEASGDLHGANLMRALLRKDPDAQFRFWGGDSMREVAGEPVRHIRDLAIMGFVEVMLHLRTVLGNIRLCKRIFYFPQKPPAQGDFYLFHPYNLRNLLTIYFLKNPRIVKKAR